MIVRLNTPRAAKGFPWKTHRTVAEIESDLELLERLDRISKHRELTFEESKRMERIIYGSGIR